MHITICSQSGSVANLQHSKPTATRALLWYCVDINTGSKRSGGKTAGRVLHRAYEDSMICSAGSDAYHSLSWPKILNDATATLKVACRWCGSQSSQLAA